MSNSYNQFIGKQVLLTSINVTVKGTLVAATDDHFHLVKATMQENNGSGTKTHGEFFIAKPGVISVEAVEQKNPYAHLHGKRVKVQYPEITFKGTLMGYNSVTNLLALKNVKWSDNGEKRKEPFAEVSAANSLVTERISKEAKMKAFIHNPVDFSKPEHHLSEPLKSHFADVCQKVTIATGNDPKDNIKDAKLDPLLKPRIPDIYAPTAERKAWAFQVLITSTPCEDRDNLLFDLVCPNLTEEFIERIEKLP